jgi:hypothetical protein
LEGNKELTTKTQEVEERREAVEVSKLTKPLAIGDRGNSTRSAQATEVQKSAASASAGSQNPLGLRRSTWVQQPVKHFGNDKPPSLPTTAPGQNKKTKSRLSKGVKSLASSWQEAGLKITMSKVQKAEKGARGKRNIRGMAL